MKYLIAVSSLTQGSGLSRYVLSLCNLLANSNKVSVVTTHDNVDCTYERAELDKISLDIKLISLGHKSKLGKYFGAMKAVRDEAPDVVINNYNGVFQYILPLINHKIRIVHILHNDTDDFYRIGSINGGKVDGWIAPTMAIAEHFNQYTHNRYADKVRVIAHGVEEARFSERKNERLEIVYAGVLYEHKGVKILPDIISRLIKANIDIHFTIIGNGLLDDWLKEQFDKEIENGIVTMTGVIPHDEVYRLMSKADIFLYPTHLDAFGLVIAEAMMNGAIPVVTHLPGITDNLITDGKEGFLIAQDNVESFVETIIKLKNECEFRHILSEASHKKALKCFSIDVMKDAYLKYLLNDIVVK